MIGFLQLAYESGCYGLYAFQDFSGDVQSPNLRGFEYAPDAEAVVRQAGLGSDLTR